MIKKTLIITGILFLLIIISGTLFMNLAPQFGGKISKEQKTEFEKLKHYKDGKFINDEPINLSFDFKKVTTILKDLISPKKNTKPSKNIEVESFDLDNLKTKDNITKVTWLGHSSFLIQIANKTLLIDPVFSDYASPIKYVGDKRFNTEMPFSLSDLEEIDIVIISHDHYDHLDYETIMSIKSKVKHVITPLGVGNHFKAWNVNPNIINELDWWDSLDIDNLKVICTPSRHMSGRRLTDQSTTLWASWCLITENDKLYFSGDGGYGKHFKEIGNKYGPFDFGMLECGQYDHKWKNVHMIPEESVKAGIDTKSQVIMPIHWASFKLANHEWHEPADRFVTEAKKQHIKYVTPKIGETVVIHSISLPQKKWWQFL